MNNTELNNTLKSARVPVPPEASWKTFPARVLAEIRRRERASSSERQDSPISLGSRQFQSLLASAATVFKEGLRLRPAMAVAVAVAVVLIGGWMAYHVSSTSTRTDAQFTEVQKYFREIEPLFPNQIKAIVFEQQAAELVLAEDATVPASTPVYVKVCGPKGCRRFVTFSGQQIRVNGELCDVLLDRKGNILVVGRQFAWSSSGPASNPRPYQIEARPLGTT